MSQSTQASSCASPNCRCHEPVTRRDFLKWTGLSLASALAVPLPAVAGPFAADDFERLIPSNKRLDAAWIKSLYARGEPTVYRGGELEKIGMPVGGIGAGQLYLGGDGRLWHWDLFNLPQPPQFSDTNGPNYARPPKPVAPIEQGFALQVKAQGREFTRTLDSRGFLPECMEFRGQYPLAQVDYRDPALPAAVTLEAFSPFIPLQVDDSALPATVMQFTVKNTSSASMEVALVGWLQNAVCLGSGRGGQGRRRNHLVRETHWTLLHSTAEKLPAESTPAPRPEVVFETFENGYGTWTVAGEAFGSEPAAGTLPDQQRVSGFVGERLVNTFLQGDKAKGKLTSAPFTVARRFIAFLMGGGSHAGRTCMNLLVDGKPVRTATGHDHEKLEWQDWDVSEFDGRTARLEIVDDSTDGWGHINVDQIVFTDDPPSTRTPLEQRDDYGSLGLALLNRPKQIVARTQLTGRSPAEELLSGPTVGKANPEDALVEFGQPLIGGLGKRVRLAAGAEAEFTFVITWFFPGLRRSLLGPLVDIEKLRRSYARRFRSAADVAGYVGTHIRRLARHTRAWHRTWYDSTLPYWFLDRTFASICTLATSTCYQFDNGRFYAFEGVYCCQGTCQHVWNYAQSVARIFPSLERDLRERTDFGTAWHENGAIDYRGECARHVAHDGQCGVILRAWREHQMAADDRYLQTTWPRIRKSVEYMMSLEGGEDGLLTGEQYNTLDAAWYGPMAWISSFYVAALRAGEAMARRVGDEAFAARCQTVATRGTQALVQRLYNGEYFIHKPDDTHPKATNTNDGCHIDQLMGQAWAWQVALPRVTPVAETRSALEAIWKYNFTPDVGPFRDASYIKGGRWYAMAGEGGVVMTTFPRGGVERATGNGGFGYYFNEVWTGQEHQLAAHMIWEGLVDEGLVITRMVHDRHHAAKRNPYNEVECSDHYTRAMSSHGSFLAACGYEHDGPSGHLGFAPRIRPDNFRAGFTTAEGWGTFAQRRTASSLTARLQLASGRLRLRSLALDLAVGSASGAKVTLRGKRVSVSMTQTGTRVLLSFAPELIVEAGWELVATLS